MLNPKGMVRRIIESDDDFLVSFPHHGGYFQVEDPALGDTLRDALRREVSFIYDERLRIWWVAPRLKRAPCYASVLRREVATLD